MIKAAAYNGCQALALQRVVGASARENLLFLPERLPERPMALVLIDKLKTLATEIVRSKVDYVVGASWAELAVGEDHRAKIIELYW